ncbi:MAG: adenylyl-sulfate kinase [Firmicutes bacterium]|nr:adenylyl-sulfate kinase [Bacillota bacterium]
MKELLKFITCGSVDDGKSTLIGRMLYDAKLLFADQKQALVLDSKIGSRGGEIDYSLLLDGLAAEREQGITIDVAYRYFTTKRRSFIVADTPGHEEYTRNMAVGASFADLAVILVDSSKGIQIQTRRHARICSLMGIRHFVFALNKMDLIDYDADRFGELKRHIDILTAETGLRNYKVIPVSATEGDNITTESKKLPWYHGETLLEWLEQVDVHMEEEEGFVLPVQRVCRPDSRFRGFAGQVESGSIKTGDEITVLPGEERARVSRLFWTDEERSEVSEGMPVTVCLDREIDISRGSVLVSGAEMLTGNLFSAMMLWMDDNRLVEGKRFLLKLSTQKVPATVMKIEYKIDVNTGDRVPAREIRKNEIVRCEISLTSPIVFDRFENHRSMGGFILIDRVTNTTSACGTVSRKLGRSENIIRQDLDVTREMRAASLDQKPLTIWFTGLSGAGKSTLANAVEKQLAARGMHTMLLDGDNIRLGINNNLGFTEADRIENIRRVGEVAKLMNDAGLITLTALISPYRSDRRRVREIVGDGSFVEVYVSTPLEECEKRDAKGLYRKARKGEISEFTGIGSPYEVPENPEITIDTSTCSIDEATDILMRELEQFLR